MLRWLAAGSLGFLVGSTFALPLILETRTALHTRVANIHVEYKEALQGDVLYTYGSCDSNSDREAYHTVARNAHGKPHRLVWIIPRDAKSGGCISAWSQDGVLVGRSERQAIRQEGLLKEPNKRDKVGRNLDRRHKDGIPMNSSSGIDVWGPWFDGVAALEGKNLSAVDVKKAKNKEVAIVGAGLSGLMTYLILHQAGLKKVKILEASKRLGGRVHTEYLSGGPFNYSYQEMGPMRIPYTTVFANVTYNITDHQLVFQLAQEMNKLNKGDRNLSVDFIPWIQNSPNGLVYAGGRKLESGLPPTLEQIAANASLGPPQQVMSPSVKGLSEQIEEKLPAQDFLIKMARNMFQAHSEYIKNGGPDKLPGDRWSEFAFMVNYLNASLADANTLTGGVDASGYLERLYERLIFNPKTEFKTIDGGLNRLPLSFHPLVDNLTCLNAKVERIQWNEKTEKVTIQWRGNYTEKKFSSETFDYAIIAAPFTVVRRWRLPDLPTTMRNAINSLTYWSACKVALEYKSRFWEHFEKPIYGSCSTTSDIPGIGLICYPSYNINGSGPASVLASFQPGPPLGVDWSAISEEQHVQYTIDAMAEIHGDIANREYTGKYNRRCWTLDEFEGGGWASPTIGSHQLYLPEFFTTHKHMIFVGEHTSYTHAWMASALESGIRGGVQLLLELGLVDEAKDAVDKWMARWISV